MSRHLKLIAAVAVVLVALSGFSPARSSGGKGGGSRSSSGSKSGGCSSSSSSSHSSSSYDDDDNDSSYTSGSTSGGRRYNSTTGTGSRYNNSNNSRRDSEPSTTVTQCAAGSGTSAKAVVSVRNPNRGSETYEVKVEFDDASGLYVDSGTAEVTVGSKQEKPVDVRMSHPDRIGEVSACKVVSVR
jgi:hypothetical protein